MSKKILIFLLVISQVFADSNVDVQADLDLKCNVPRIRSPPYPEYRYRIELYERDFFFDDLIAYNYGYTTNNDTVVTLNGHLDGDEMFSKFYELKVEIEHSCTASGKEITATRNFKYVCHFNDEKCHYKLSMVLDDAGDTKDV